MDIDDLVLSLACPWCDWKAVTTTAVLAGHCEHEHPAEFAELTLVARNGR